MEVTTQGSGGEVPSLGG